MEGESWHSLLEASRMLRGYVGRHYLRRLIAQRKVEHRSRREVGGRLRFFLPQREIERLKAELGPRTEARDHEYQRD